MDNSSKPKIANTSFDVLAIFRVTAISKLIGIHKIIAPAEDGGDNKTHFYIFKKCCDLVFLL